MVHDEVEELLALRDPRDPHDGEAVALLGGQDPDHVLRGLLSDELARLPDLGDADFTLKALKTEQWSFRWTLASIRAYQLGLPTLMPFYADEVVDFFLRVPTDRLPGRRLQTAYLRRHHPDLAGRCPCHQASRGCWRAR